MFKKLSIIFSVVAIVFKGGDSMVDMYLALTIAGRRSLDGVGSPQVPAKFREAVRTELRALGLDDNGNPISEETE